jgi:antitoxin HicB
MSEYHYTILLTPEEGGYTVTVPAIPAIATEGDTVEEAIAMAKDAIKLYLDVLKERGEPIPVEEAPPRMVVVDVAA